VPSLGFGEILIILVLALIIFGPRRLPEMGRTIGRSLREFRRATSDLRAEIESDAGEPAKVTAEERTRRVAQRKGETQGDDDAPEPPPPKGEAPPT
jgi:sec-independent protein translocase protein TatA